MLEEVDVVLELARTHGMKHAVREVLEAEVRTADELWMTSSTKEVLPITSLDGCLLYTSPSPRD